MTTATALMAVGAVGSALPLVGRGVPTGRVRWAHMVMVVVMVGMLASDMSAWTVSMSGVALIAAAWAVTAGGVDRCVGMPCAADLTAMGVLMLTAPTHRMSSATHAMIESGGHGHSGAAGGPPLAATAVLVGWAVVAVHLHVRTGPPRARSLGATGLMMIGMLPLVL